MKIKSYLGEYSAYFYSDFSFFEELKNKKDKFFIIDKKVYDLYKDVLDDLIEDCPIHLVEAIEENKNVNTSLEIIEEMVSMKSKRSTLLVAIGGGIVQDIAAFIANILYRGIKWVLIPTTLLSQTDSCIGSKSSMNFKNYKNILGYFYPPTEIYINTNFIKTLERRDYFSGLGEIMKCAIMAGYESFLKTSDNMHEILEYKEEVLLEEIKKALAFKQSVIEIDEFDKDYRNIMNFGHTFGHALETTSHYAVPHGQGVSMGMLLANRISLDRGLITDDQYVTLNTSIRRIITPELINRDYFNQDYIETLKKDKKYTGTHHACILFDGKGVKKNTDVTDEEILSAIERLFERGI